MERKTVISMFLRFSFAVCILTQIAFADKAIDSALQEKAKMLSPGLARDIMHEEQESHKDSELIMEQGLQAMDQGKYKEAYHYFTASLERNPRNITAETKLATVNAQLYDVNTQIARNRSSVGDYESAISYYTAALDHKATGKEAIRGIRQARLQLSKSVSKNLGKMITDDMNTEQKVDLLMKQAQDSQILSKYEEAKELYKQAIKIKPSAKAPRRAYKDLLVKQSQLIDAQKRHERDEIMRDLINEFLRDRPDFSDVSANVADKENDPGVALRAAVIKKAQARTGELSFRDASVDDVVGYLCDISGIGVVLEVSEKDNVKIDFTMQNPTVLEAIEYMCETAGLVFDIEDHAIIISDGEGEMETRTWTVSSEAISRAAEGDDEEGGEEEDFDFFGGDEEEEEEDSFGDSLSAVPEIVKIILESVPQPEGSSVFLEPVSGTLSVRNTPRNLSLTADIIADFEEGSEQLLVEIQTKFVQISDENLNEWMFGIQLKDAFKLMSINGDKRGRAMMMNPTDFTGALRQFSTGARASRYSDKLSDVINMVGISEGQNQITSQILGFFTSALTDPEMGIVWKALDMQTNADILSAPSVTTISGQANVLIKQIIEVMYPKDYTVYKPAIVYFAGQASSPIGMSMSSVAATYPGYATVEDVLVEEVGIELKVSPTIGDDNKSVSMEIETSISREIEPHIVNAYSGDDSVSPPIEPINLLVPRFRFAEVKTQVVVNDGETIVLGGMVTEELHRIRDKVPFWGDLPLVGRYFRSESNYQEKVNLLIFVKTDIITPTGESWRDIQSRELRKEAEKVEKEALEMPDEELADETSEEVM